MFNYVVDLATGDFVIGGPFTPPYNANTQIVVTIANHPDMENEKYVSGNIVPKSNAEKKAWRKKYGPKDVDGFETQLRNNVFNGTLGFNTFLVKYPLLLWELRAQKWNRVEALVIEALAQNDIDRATYDAIKTKADQKDIPLTL